MAVSASGLVLVGTLLATTFIALGRRGRKPPCDDWGDVNGDGRVSNLDAKWVAQYLLGERSLTAEQLVRANVTGTGTVNDDDVFWISRYAAGKVSTFPVCG